MAMLSVPDCQHRRIESLALAQFQQAASHINWNFHDLFNFRSCSIYVTFRTFLYHNNLAESTAQCKPRNHGQLLILVKQIL